MKGQRRRTVRRKRLWIPVTISLLAIAVVIVLYWVRLRGSIFQKADLKTICMASDEIFQERISTVALKGQEYSVCCNLCSSALEKNPKLLFAHDPVTNKQVNKSQAIIAINRDRSVFYFENDATYRAYRERIIPGSSKRKHRP